MMTGLSTSESEQRDACRLPIILWLLLWTSGSIVAQEASWPLPERAPLYFVGAQFGLNSFDKIYRPMQQATIYAATRRPVGTAYVKFIRARRFETSGSQIEVELYPTFSGGYGYVDYAYGEFPVFPRHRFGAEAFLGLPSGFEASIGGRYYDFQSQSVSLVTGSVNYYSGSFVFIIRPYVGIGEGSSSFSASLTTRYYLSETEEFIFGRVGGGFSPDERWIQSPGGVLGRSTAFLQSQTVGSGIQKLLVSRVLLLASLDLTRQEVAFSPGTFVLDVELGVGVRVAL